MLTTDQKGAIAELAIAREAAELGVGVFKPLTDGERYDLIFDFRPQLMRVQCKWAPLDGQTVIVRCYSNRRAREGLRRRAYTADEADAIGAYCPDLRRSFLVPASQFDGHSQLLLRLAASRNNQRLGINWADDFDLGARLVSLLGAVAQLGERSDGIRKVRGSIPLGSIAITEDDQAAGSPLQRTGLGSADLQAAWEEHAEEFIAWAREPGFDSYWRFHRDQFLQLVPPPSRRTLDLGCGEGRLSRDLKALGHTVVAVDASPTMVAAARDADSELEAHLSDAADLPFEDGTFDLVVAFMSLQDMDDFEGAILEAARVLMPDGRLCLAVVHPLSSAGRFDGDDPTSPFLIDGSYLGRNLYEDHIERDGLVMTFVSEHRPIQAYVDALADAGLLVERLRETDVPDSAITRRRSRRWQRIPLFLHIRAVKRA